MIYEIKNRFTGETLFSAEAETLRDVVLLAITGYANLRSADLGYANLRSADLSSADLRSANLRSADLSYANLSYANLSYANLRYADLRYANLRSADLRSADLRYADLSYADLSSADLSYANLRYADLRYADLSYAKQRVIRINGSRHEITSIDEMVFVGCIHHTITWWMGHYVSAGKKEGYSEAQITEYGMHFAHIEALLKLPWPQESI